MCRCGGMTRTQEAVCSAEHVTTSLFSIFYRVVIDLQRMGRACGWKQLHFFKANFNTNVQYIVNTHIKCIKVNMSVCLVLLNSFELLTEGEPILTYHTDYSTSCI